MPSPRREVQQEQRAIINAFKGELESLKESFITGGLIGNPEAERIGRGMMLELLPVMKRIAGLSGFIEEDGGVSYREQINATKVINDFYKTAGGFANGLLDKNVGGTTININLPSGDEARAILGRLAGEKRSRIVDIEAEATK